jgi:hypothetical protein
MTLPLLRRVAVQVLVVTVALAAVLTSGAPAQSLGDVAKQEEARRKSGAGKVYTNDDLRSAPAPATTPEAKPDAKSGDGGAKASDKPAAKADAKADPKTDAKADAKSDAKADAKADPKTDAKADARPADPKGDAASWKKRRQDLEGAIDRSKLFADSLQSRINGLTADFSARDDPAQRNIVAADRQRALTELDRVKKDIQQQTKALADLQEEARKSGVPPGWLR